MEKAQGERFFSSRSCARLLRMNILAGEGICGYQTAASYLGGARQERSRCALAGTP